MEDDVVILERIIGPKARLIFIPERVLLDLYVRHVHWEHLDKDETTVFIRDKPHLVTRNEKLHETEIFRMLVTLFRLQRVIYNGENPYLIDSRVFPHIKLIKVNIEGEKVLEKFDGLMRIRAEIVKKEQVKKIIETHFGLSESSRLEIKKKIGSLNNNPKIKKITTVVVMHMNPIKK